MAPQFTSAQIVAAVSFHARLIGAPDLLEQADPPTAAPHATVYEPSLECSP